MKEILLTKGQVALVDDDDYEKLSQFKWVARWNKATQSYYGFRRGSRKGSGPKRVSRTGKEYYALGPNIHMHREIMSPVPDGMEVDHVNRNTLDNRKENLRHASHAQNNYNRPGNEFAKVPFKGVTQSYRCKTFFSRIRKDGVNHYLGSFKTPVEAAMAYNEAAKRLHGEFAYLNPIPAEEAA
jgi:hypothetical protein